MNKLSKTRCVGHINEEVQKLLDKSYVGSVAFQFNFYKGGITNLKIVHNESVEPTQLKESI